MKFLRLYLRVLELLGREARLGWILALANLALASAMFVEPLLFGRIIDTLANAQTRVSDLQLRDLMLLLAAWVGFALFAIVCSTLVALHADRLAHRQYQVVRTMFFEHVLQLPLSYYTGSHSGRLVKVMMTGTNTLWALWLAFFREHFASFVSLIVLMPLTLFINWRYGLLLIVLCCIFAMLIALVVSNLVGVTVLQHYLVQRVNDDVETQGRFLGAGPGGFGQRSNPDVAGAPTSPALSCCAGVWLGVKKPMSSMSASVPATIARIAAPLRNVPSTTRM